MMLKSPLPAGERSTRIVRCAAGEGSLPALGTRESPSPGLHLTMQSDLSPAGRGEGELLKPEFIAL
jgi:hypothetical protein